MAWDDAPRNEYTANAMVDACKLFAGDAALDLRRHLQACRRAGMSRTAAITSWESDW